MILTDLNVSRYLFFSDWGIRPRIEVCDLLGNNRRTIVDSNLVHPRGLALDMSQDRIFWVDSGIYSVESASLNGMGREVFRIDTGTSYYGIAVHKVREVVRSLNFISKVEMKMIKTYVLSVV